jgi:Uma2 family endonuclease
MAARALARTSILTSDSLPAQGEWTYEDYSRLPDDGWRYEVIRGVLHVTPAPNWKHQMASGNLFFSFRDFLRAEPLGKVCAAPFDVLLPGNLATPVQPDLFFISRARLHIVKGRLIEGAPDLVVEILSPSNWLDDRKTKFELYAEAGALEYWIADSREPAVEVFVLRNGAYELLGKFGPGERVRSEVLPGFTPAIDEIFAD